MNRISREAVDEFEKRLRTEKELLFGCQTDAGFFKRISTSFLPFLRRDPVSSEIIGKWQESCVDMSLIAKANGQVVTAFLELWRYAKQAKNLSLKRSLIQILRKVKGPARYIEISSQPFSRTISFHLRKLYAEHIANTEDFSFAPAVLELEKRNAEWNALADNDPSLVWLHMITLENCQTLVSTPVLSMRWETIRGDKLSIGIRAYAAQQKFHLAFSAEELRFFGRSNRAPQYFVREKFQKYIDRLCQELLRLLHATVVEELPVHLVGKTSAEIHWRKKQFQEDLSKLCPIGKIIWKESIKNCADPSSISQKNVADEIKRVAEARQISLHSKVPNRYKAAAKKTDPRIYRDGKYQGLKSGL